MKMVNTKQIISLICVFWLIGVTGCSEDHEPNSWNEQTQLSINYDVSGFVGEIPTKTAATPEEKQLQTVYALFYSRTNNQFVQAQKATVTETSFEVELPQKGVSYNIRFIANLDDYTAGQTDVVAWLNSSMQGKTFADGTLVVTAPAGRMISAPGLLMHGVLENTNDYTGTSIPLARNVAKVNVITNTGIKLNTSKGAYLCNNTSTIDAFAGTEVMNGSLHTNQFGQVVSEQNKVSVIDDNTLNSIYIFPRATDGDTDEDNTSLSIWLERTDGANEGWYRLNIMGSNNQINRNYIYNITVKKLAVSGTTDPGDVFDKDPLNVLGDVDFDWDDELVMVGDGVHWMQVSPRAITLYMDQLSDDFILTDNFDDDVALVADGLQQGGYFTTVVSSDNKVLTISVPDTMTGNAKADFTIRKSNLIIPVTVEYKHMNGHVADVDTGNDTDEGFGDGGTL